MKEKLAKQIFDECLADNEPITMAEALEMAEMEIKAKGIKNYTTTEKNHKTKTAKPKKVNERKKFFTDKMAEVVAMSGVQVNVKNENEFSFTEGEDSYTVKIILHRPKK